MLDKSFSFILAYPSSVVSHILDQFNPSATSTVFDPFCGTGTTLVESKRRGLSSVGIEVNPVCAMASSVKTHWEVDIVLARKELAVVLRRSKSLYQSITDRYQHANSLFHAPEVCKLTGHEALMNSGVIKRGWISRRPALMALILTHFIRRVTDQQIRDLLMTPMLGALVKDFSNLKYGPELYRARTTRSIDGFSIYSKRAKLLLQSIEEHKSKYGHSQSSTICGSSLDPTILEQLKGKIRYVITSPPYPAEHDYSRMTRLELVFGGFVGKFEELIQIKRAMVPSSSKCCYVDQQYYNLVKEFSFIRNIRRRIFNESKSRTHGFAKVYPRLVGDYFGAMYLHFKSLDKILPRGGKCAYVVGDQSSFFGIRINTASLLSKMLSSSSLSFKVIGIETLRTRRATRGTGNKSLPERILYFEKL